MCEGKLDESELVCRWSEGIFVKDEGMFLKSEGILVKGFYESVKESGRE